MERLVTALVLPALLTALAQSSAAIEDLDTTGQKEESLKSLSELIEDTGSTNSSVRNGVLNEMQTQTNPIAEIDTNLDPATGSLEVTHSIQNPNDVNNSNNISRRALAELHDGDKISPRIEEEHEQIEMSKLIKKDAKHINPISFNFENEVTKRQDLTDYKHKSTFVRSADDSGDLDDNSKRSTAAVSQAIAMAQVDDVDGYSSTPNKIPYYNRDNLKIVPRDEIIPAHDLIGENIIVRCAYEGEMMVVQSARAGCLVCACVGASSLRAVCAACGACALPTPALQPPARPIDSCDHHPPSQFFTDPLNPCRQCICVPNTYGILTPTCMPNPDCKMQPPEPQIIPTPPWIPLKPTNFPPTIPYPYAPGPEIVIPPTQIPDNPTSLDLYPMPPLFPPAMFHVPNPAPHQPYPPYVIPPEPQTIEPILSPTPYSPLVPSAPGLDEPLKWPPKSPLPGPRPHKSCSPFPEGVPFQHPWSECLACVCEHVTIPPISDIEVTCHTKPSCCIEPTTSVGPPRESTTQLQIMDRICEARPLGLSFLDPRDSCRMCVCRAFGTHIAPACIPAPLSSSLSCGMQSGKNAKEINIKFIEPRCKYTSPYQPYIVGCSRCICEIVFSYVIAQCTPLTNCVDPRTLPSGALTPWPTRTPPGSWSTSLAAASSGAINQISNFRPTNDLNLDFYQNNDPPNSMQKYPFYQNEGSGQDDAVAQADASSSGGNAQAASLAQIDSNAAFAQADVSSFGDSGALAQADSSAANSYPYASVDSQIQSLALADTAFAQADASSFSYSPEASASGIAQESLFPSNNLYTIDSSGSNVNTVSPILLDGSPYGNMLASQQGNNRPQYVGSNPFTGFPYDSVYPYSSNGKPVSVTGINSTPFGNSYPYNPSTSYGQSRAPPTINGSPYSNNVYQYPQITNPFQTLASSPSTIPPYSYLNPYPSGSNPTQAFATSQAASSVFDNSYLYDPSGKIGSAQPLVDSFLRNSNPPSKIQASVVTRGEMRNLFPGNNGSTYNNKTFPDPIAPLRYNDITPTNRNNKDNNQQYNNVLPYSKISSPPLNINSQFNIANPSVTNDGTLNPNTDSTFSPTEGYYSPATDPYSFNYARPTVKPPWASLSSTPVYGGSDYSTSEGSDKKPSYDPYSKARLYHTGGRGQCHFDGDMYHARCQACICRADAAGKLLATCYGTPCS